MNTPDCIAKIRETKVGTFFWPSGCPMVVSDRLWNSPRDAYESRPLEFYTLSRWDETECAAIFADKPQWPGEYCELGRAPIVDPNS